MLDFLAPYCRLWFEFNVSVKSVFFLLDHFDFRIVYLNLQISCFLFSNVCCFYSKLFFLNKKKKILFVVRVWLVWLVLIRYLILINFFYIRRSYLLFQSLFWNTENAQDWTIFALIWCWNLEFIFSRNVFKFILISFFCYNLLRTFFVNLGHDLLQFWLLSPESSKILVLSLFSF